ncbi:unnamed protein product [Effrenium voratum]|nr:unnamed protein product [Effrenium voratum]
MKLRHDGAHLWTVLRGGSGSDEAHALQVDADGNVLVTGSTDSTSLDGQTTAGSFDIVVMKLRHDGAHLWTVLRGGSGSDEAHALQAQGR